MPASSTDFDQITLEVNGFRFQARVAGPADGPLALFLHGFPEFADAWVPIMSPLAASGYRTVAVDQRGYSPGARPPDVEDYATELLVSDVLGFADALDARQFHLVAHDWGGLLAWKLAAERSERLLSLSVLSTPHTDAFRDALQNDADQKRRSSYIALIRLPAHAAELALMADHAKLLRASYQGMLPPERVEENVRRLSEPHALTSALNWYRALDLKAAIGSVCVPTLFVWGSQDQALGETAARDTANHVTGPYRFEVLEGASHWLLEEAPEAVSALLLEQLTTFGSADTPTPSLSGGF